MKHLTPDSENFSKPMLHAVTNTEQLLWASPNDAREYLNLKPMKKEKKLPTLFYEESAQLPGKQDFSDLFIYTGGIGAMILLITAAIFSSLKCVFIALALCIVTMLAIGVKMVGRRLKG